nr:hypothetical protein BaRGS_021340 [Batillaria attramentaria]
MNGVRGNTTRQTVNLPMNEVARRFIIAMRKQQGVRKLEAIRCLARREDFVNWKDEHGLDILHHAIINNYPDACDFLLKLGYFAEPYEPDVNLYAHLAARMGYLTTLRVIITHRPRDFKRAIQPLFFPRLVVPIWQMIYTGGKTLMPGVLGNSTGYSSGKRVTVKKKEDAVFLPGPTVKTIDCVARPGLMLKTMVDVRTDTLWSLPDVVSAMIQRDYCVETKLPSRTYPLYTCIACSIRYDDLSLAQHYVRSMDILCNHGANPNFDEMAFEKQNMMKKEFKMTWRVPCEWNNVLFVDALTHYLMITVHGNFVMQWYMAGEPTYPLMIYFHTLFDAMASKRVRRFIMLAMQELVVSV